MRVMRAAVVLLVGFAAWPALAQEDRLAEARRHFEQAAYEEALQVLSASGEIDAPAIAVEVHLLRALSLVALGRDAEAREAMAQVVETDPVFQLAPAAAAPRVRAMFLEVRRQHVVEALRGRYKEARAAYARGDYQAAAGRFARLWALLEAVGPTLDEAVAAASLLELQELVKGFHDLSVEHVRIDVAPAPDAATRTEAALEPGAATSTDAAAEPGAAATEKTGNGTGVVASRSGPVGSAGQAPPGQPTGTTGPDTAGLAPEATSATLPPMTPPMAVLQELPSAGGIPGLVSGRVYRGAIEIDIDAGGTVTAARLVHPIHVLYDARLIDAARRWRYQPATREGTPVPYTRVVMVTVDLR
jgi:TonB family protein